MRKTNLKQTNIKQARQWFRGRRRWHNPMLVLNMSIFNSSGGWNRIFNPVAHPETVWC